MTLVFKTTSGVWERMWTGAFIFARPCAVVPTLAPLDLAVMSYLPISNETGHEAFSGQAPTSSVGLSLPDVQLGYSHLCDL